MADEQSVKREWSQKKAPLMTRWAEQVLPRLLLLFLLIRFDVDGTTRSLRTEPPTPTIPALWWNEKSGRIWTVHFLTFAKADKSQNDYCHSLSQFTEIQTIFYLILLCFLFEVYICHCRNMGDGHPGSNWPNPLRIPSERHGPLLRRICPLWGCICSHWKKVLENSTT